MAIQKSGELDVPLTWELGLWSWVSPLEGFAGKEYYFGGREYSRTIFDLRVLTVIRDRAVRADVGGGGRCAGGSRSAVHPNQVLLL